MAFVGEYTHSIDAKNRLFIPAKFREQLGENFYITRKMNKTCLALYSEEKMQQITDNINAFPDSEVSEIKEFLYSKTVYATPDSNGRVCLSSSVIAYAGITRNAVIIGAGDHVQIWSEEQWAEQESKRDLEKMRQRLAALGL